MTPRLLLFPLEPRLSREEVCRECPKESQERLTGFKAGVTVEEQQAWARASDGREAPGATKRPKAERMMTPTPWEPGTAGGWSNHGKKRVAAVMLY